MSGKRVVSMCAAPVDRHLLDKTRMCKFFRDGKCQRGKACTFAHSTAELTAPPDLYRSQLCAEFAESGHCRYGATCRFAHGVEQLRAAPSSRLHRDDGSSDRLKQQLAAMKKQTKALEARLEAIEGGKVAANWQRQESEGAWSMGECWYLPANLEPMDYSGCQSWGDISSWAPCVATGAYGEVFAAPAPAVVLVPVAAWQLGGECDAASEPSTECGGDAQCADSDAAEASSEDDPCVVVRNTFIEYNFGAAPAARRRARSVPASVGRS
mmetsp:Transcript_5151/g.15224  ORF Transcript_5151/g.15224 Transcript_5151/m.15224 type:complete len:268 (+) Transcript_5151:70-873(+)